VVHQALVRLSVNFIRQEVVHVFNRVRNQTLKQYLFTDKTRSLNEAHNQALMLEAIKMAARPPARVTMTKVIRVPTGM
jgi:DNA-binding FadR family transcriptional regulator